MNPRIVQCHGVWWYIDVTWAVWRLFPPTTLLFVQRLNPANNKYIIKVFQYPCMGNPHVTFGIRVRSTSMRKVLTYHGVIITCWIQQKETSLQTRCHGVRLGGGGGGSFSSAIVFPCNKFPVIQNLAKCYMAFKRLCKYIKEHKCFDHASYPSDLTSTSRLCFPHFWLNCIVKSQSDVCVSLNLWSVEYILLALSAAI